MPTLNSVLLQCSNCYQEFNSEIYTYVDRAVDSDVVGTIFTGSFNFKHCIMCENEGHVRFPVQIVDSEVGGKAIFIFLHDNKLPQVYEAIENTKIVVPVEITLKVFTVKEITRDNHAEAVIYSTNDLLEKLQAWGEETAIFPSDITEEQIMRALASNVITEKEAEMARGTDFDRMLDKIIDDGEVENIDITDEESDAISIGSRIQKFCLEEDKRGVKTRVARQDLQITIDSINEEWKNILTPLSASIWNRFESYLLRAEELTNINNRLHSFIGEVAKKIYENESALGNYQDDLKYMIRILKFRLLRHGGMSKEVPWEIIIAMVAALIYFVTPIDVIPDIIPGIGFCDDIAVLLTVKSLIGDMHGSC